MDIGARTINVSNAMLLLFVYKAALMGVTVVVLYCTYRCGKVRLYGTVL